MVKFDPHLHGVQWLYHVRLIGENETGMIEIEDRFGDWIKHAVGHCQSKCTAVSQIG